MRPCRCERRPGWRRPSRWSPSSRVSPAVGGAVGRGVTRPAGGRGHPCYASRATLAPMNDELDGRLAAAEARLAAFGPVLGEGDWPLAARFDHAPEAAWGPREVLAHLAEMLPYWLGEAERIVDMTGGPEPFGRIATNDVRVAIIERDRTLPIRELVA